MEICAGDETAKPFRLSAEGLALAGRAASVLGRGALVHDCEIFSVRRVPVGFRVLRVVVKEGIKATREETARAVAALVQKFEITFGKNAEGTGGMAAAALPPSGNARHPSLPTVALLPCRHRIRRE